VEINKDWRWILIFLVVDIICAGMGMGVPFFNILLGFPLGWFLARKFVSERRVFKYSFFTSAFTFLIMAIIWSLAPLTYLSDPTKDIANFGEPQILFTPVASFYGWLVLMIFISPFLQLLTTIFAAYVTLLFQKNHLKSG
jgi:hypothetical protein